MDSGKHQGGHEEKVRKIAFSEIHREVKRAGEAGTGPRETETDIDRAQVETEQIKEGDKDQETERNGGKMREGCLGRSPQRPPETGFRVSAGGSV